MYCARFLIFGMLISMSLADDADTARESLDDVKDRFEGAIGDSMKGFGDWFKNAADDVKGRAEDGVETMREFSNQAKDKSESGMEAAKGFAGGIGDRFTKMKETFEENGEKMKEALSGAAQKSKTEFETAASSISKFGKDASETMLGLFKFR